VNTVTLRRHDGIEAVLPRWREFEREAHGTLYQSALWCRAWSETAGAARKVQPVILTLERAGEIRALLPLQIRRRQGVRVLEWLTAPHHGYGGPMLARSLAEEERRSLTHEWDRILATAGPFDAVSLTEIPERLPECENPLWDHCNMMGANDSYALALTPDFDALHRSKSSAERRRSARKHEAALARAGSLSFGLPASKEDLHRLIDAMFEQQEKRLAEHGIRRAFGPDEHRFVHRLADLQDDADPVLAPYHLSIDGAVQAVALGGLYGHRYWALISSLAAGPLRKYSPGDAALRMTIKACCERGLKGFDLSAGVAPYKIQWADETIRLGAVLRGRNGRGIAWAGSMALKSTLKRLVKQTPPLLRASKALRRMLFGRAPEKI
jgi:CelD/BcsL family acetyltransferase involved in cellulose biosynthesis